MFSDKELRNSFLSYSGRGNFAKLISGMSFIGETGAAHSDGVFYLFKIFMMPSSFEGTMIDRVTTLWTNFAKYG